MAHKDYSGTPLARKLGIKRGHVVALVDAPDGFLTTLGQLPEDVTVRSGARGSIDVALLFSRSRAQLRRRFNSLMRALDPAGGLWVAYPKKSSGIATDLDFAWVQQYGLDQGLVDNKSCAVDDIYSGLRFVYRLRDRPAPDVV
jgi:hypothetical protein